MDCTPDTAVLFQVVGGVLVHQTRRGATSACKARFSKLYFECSTTVRTGGQALVYEAAQALQSLSPFGRDPTFNPASTLFHADLQGSEGDYFNTTIGSTELSVYSYPFAFFARSMLRHPDGFPIVLQVRSGPNPLLNCSPKLTASQDS